jgi:hypothetical protein
LVEIFRALWAHKLRSFLTMFGIAWKQFVIITTGLKVLLGFIGTLTLALVASG